MNAKTQRKKQAGGVLKDRKELRMGQNLDIGMAKKKRTGNRQNPRDFLITASNVLICDKSNNQ